MSLALESLMPAHPRRDDHAPGGGGILSFLLIGGVAALSFVILSSILVAAFPGVEAWQVSAACYAGFIVPVYLLHRHFTFGSSVAHIQALPRYIAVQAVALVLACLFSFVFHGTLALPSLPAAILVIALTSGLNYLVLKGWAFAFRPSAKAVAA